MKTSKYVVMESIHFQTTALFEELTQQLDLIKTEKFTGKLEDFYKSTPVKKLLDIIFDYTGVSLKYDVIRSNYGPTILINTFNFNHIFVRDYEKVYFSNVKKLSDIYQNLETNTLNGTIDLKNAKLTGDFTKVESIILLPFSLLSKGILGKYEFTSREVSSLLLHEVGHVFTNFEYASRSIKTNQVIASIISALDKKDPEKLEQIYVKSETYLNMTEQQKKALRNSKDDQSVAVVLISMAIDASVSELGESVFDESSSEQLADQFCARLGGGKDLMTGLNKIGLYRKGNPIQFYRDQFLTGLFITITSVFPPLALIYLYVAYVSADKSINRSDLYYGTFHTRMSRIRSELIQRLKDKDIDNKEKKEILLALETANDIIDNEVDKLSFFESLGYLLNPKFRSDHKYEVLQKQLEAMANNGLFEKAAKLSTLSIK